MGLLQRLAKNAMLHRGALRHLVAAALAASLLVAHGPATPASQERFRVRWVDAGGAELSPDTDALSVISPVAAHGDADTDRARFRVLVDAAPGRPLVRLGLASVDGTSGRVRDRLRWVVLRRDGEGHLATPWLVLVSNAGDRSSPQLAGRALRVALGDLVEARVRRGGGRAVVHRIPVGRPPGEDHPRSIRQLRLRVTVLRTESGGPPIVGGDLTGARDVIAHQVAVIDEVLAACGIRAGPAEAVEIVVVDPPGPCLLSVGGRTGLPSAGGEVRLVVDGERLGPLRVGSGYAPVETARFLAHAIEDAGYTVDLTINARMPSAAFPTADVLVRRADGSLAELGVWREEPLTTDSMQELAIGAVRLDDGLEPYGANDIAAGTLEERTLVKALAGGDPSAVEIFVISRFTGLQKQGESFVRANRSSMRNAAIVDWRALERARQAYTLAHELGHVLLDDLEHPDTHGDRRPFLLMHSRSASAVGGPMRVTPVQCEAMRARAAALAGQD